MADREYQRKWREMHPGAATRAKKRWRDSHLESAREAERLFSRNKRVKRHTYMLEWYKKNTISWEPILSLPEWNCCFRCGVSREIKRILFHHKEPEKKLFQISTAMRSLRFPEFTIFMELSKCIPVCYSCHRAIHNSQKGVA